MRRRRDGQTLAEFALVAPLALAAIFAIFSLGLWVFYQQQVTNVAREAARWAAIHSDTAICPTSGWRDPQAPPGSYPLFPNSCDGVGNAADPYPWPKMTFAARTSVWGVSPASVKVNACWSGYVLPTVDVASFHGDYSAPAFPLADHPSIEAGGYNTFVHCHIAGKNPTTETDQLGCSEGMTTTADDPASDIPNNEVTAYACMVWSPPLAGFLGIPPTVTMRAVVSEVIHRQQ